MSMKNVLAISLALGAVLVSSSTFAADYNSYSQPSSPFSGTSAAYDWSGFYAGVSAGYSWGDASLSNGGPGLAAVDLNPAGLSGGVQAGVNFDMGGLVVGAETDINLSGIKDSYNAAAGVFTSKLDYYGSFRGRVGAAFENVLPYLTAGLAYGGNTTTANRGGGTLTESKLHVGFQLGAGVEMAVTDAISVKGEYLYTGLRGQTYELSPSLNNDVSFHTVRVGVNYKF
jgi:outer membrane immunogenic protein